MPPKRGRARKGDRRIDAAIDHFAAKGYTARQVRAAVTALLKEYLGTAAWPFLEDCSFLVVQEKLLEMEDEEKKLLLPLEQEAAQEEQEQPQQQEPAVDEVLPGNSMPILEVHSVVPAGTESSDEEVEDPMFIKPPALEAVVPLAEATRTGETRCPCYGWLSESEDEEQQTSQQEEVHVPSPGGGSICKRMWLE